MKAFSVYSALMTGALCEATDVSAAGPLSNDGVYVVSNIYNAGVADGFVRSFTGYRPKDAGNAYLQQRDVWPRGPTAGGSHGASVTYDGPSQRRPCPPAGCA